MSKNNYPALGRSLAGKFYLPAEPAPQTDSLAVAAAAELSDSKLPAPGATPGAGCSAEHAVSRSDTAALRAKLGLRYER